MAAGNVLINQGTQTAIAIDSIGTVDYQVIKLDIGALGSSSPFTGSIPQVGTLSVGTVSTVGLIHPNYFSTTVFTGTNTLGTVKTSPGAGTRIYITDILVSVGSPSNVVLGDGAASTPLTGTLFFAQNGGVALPFQTPLRTSQGGTLVFQQSAAIGSCTVTVNGFTAP